MCQFSFVVVHFSQKLRKIFLTRYWNAATVLSSQILYDFVQRPNIELYLIKKLWHDDGLTLFSMVERILIFSYLHLMYAWLLAWITRSSFSSTFLDIRKSWASSRPIFPVMVWIFPTHWLSLVWSPTICLCNRPIKA